VNFYRPPLSDIQFLLDTFDYEGQVGALPQFADYDLETCIGLIEAYGKYCMDVLMPLNGVGDQVGVRFDPETGDVHMPDGFKEAYEGYCANGYASLPHDPEYGGMGAPITLSIMAQEVISACNKSFSMCPGLTSGLIEALTAHGSDELKARLLPRLVTGEWAGTMCLTEPQCGTDLGLLTTKAEPFGDHFKLTGTKTWITYGEHGMTDNIIHFVLARLPDAPEGIKGISTFVVPKVLEDGTRNGVVCGGTDHKMGIHASPTCVINLEDAEGWLVGVPHKGMRSMFTMMNAARLQVGCEGVSLGEAAYQNALAFAKDRRQSRSLDPSKVDHDHGADNILVHPDVRRMLLNIKSTTEGLRGLVAWIAINYDLMHHSVDKEQQEKAEDLVALLTPIIKSYGSERGFQNISEAMQVMAGAGYTADWPVEQYLRDERIAMIYEGTNHIQALDLVGRKLPMGGGKLMRVFAGEVGALLKETLGDERTAMYANALKVESKRLNETTMTMAAAGMQDNEVIGAVASNYLNQFALVTLGYVWLRQVKAVIDRPLDDNLRRSKLQTARYFFELVLPEAAMYAAKVAVGKAPMMDVDVDLL
jgi:alkylation response protein AidB-like acyl-CoA dehydrogenase